MGARGRALARGTFSLDKVIPAHFKVYGVPF